MPVRKVYRKRFGAGNLVVEVVEEYIVVAAAVHLAEAEFELFFAQVVDIHELGVELRVSARNAVCQRVGGIERGKHGYAEQYCVVMERNIVGD